MTNINVTEAEARKRWCPFMRFPSGYGGGFNNPHDTNQARCVGSKCMAWQSSPIKEDEGRCGMLPK